jgi:hypothetical protein
MELNNQSIEYKTVTIPAKKEHLGLWSMQVKLKWICPICGCKRGTVKKGRSYDGSRTLMVDTWENECGHIDKYEALRKEAKED